MENSHNLFHVSWNTRRKTQQCFSLFPSYKNFWLVLCHRIRCPLRFLSSQLLFWITKINTWMNFFFCDKWVSNKHSLVLLWQYKSHPNARVIFHSPEAQSNSWVKVALKYTGYRSPFSWCPQQLQFTLKLLQYGDLFSASPDQLHKILPYGAVQ